MTLTTNSSVVIPHTMASGDAQSVFGESQIAAPNAQGQSLPVDRERPTRSMMAYLTAPRAMRAVVRAKTNIGGNIADTEPVQISIHKNGAEVHRVRDYISGVLAPDIAISEAVTLGKGDYIEIFATANGSGSPSTPTIAGGSMITSLVIEEL